MTWCSIDEKRRNSRKRDNKVLLVRHDRKWHRHDRYRTNYQDFYPAVLLVMIEEVLLFLFFLGVG